MYHEYLLWCFCLFLLCPASVCSDVNVVVVRDTGDARARLQLRNAMQAAGCGAAAVVNPAWVRDSVEQGGVRPVDTYRVSLM